MEDKAPCILHSQYHGCWWPDDTRSQIISSHGIDLNLPEYSYSSTRSVMDGKFNYLSVGFSMNQFIHVIYNINEYRSINFWSMKLNIFLGHEKIEIEFHKYFYTLWLSIYRNFSLKTLYGKDNVSIHCNNIQMYMVMIIGIGDIITVYSFVHLLLGLAYSA